MIKKFRALPEPLQRHLLIQFCLAALFLLLAVLAIMTYRDMTTFLLGVILSAAYFAYVIYLFYRMANHKYVIISGVCSESEVTPVRKRVKAFYLRTTAEEKEIILKVAARHRIKKIPAGCSMDLYVDEKTTLHERDGCHFLYSYWAVKIRGL